MQASLAHYRILDEIGRGGMGVVYQAHDAELDRVVAIKVLAPELTADPENIDRLRREARTLAKLNHPSIVTVFSVGEANGQVYLVMERVEGRTVSELIPAGGLPLERLFRIAVPVADALTAAHERGIVHRDLKPGNVMVTDEGRVKVLDFGLARRVSSAWGAPGEETATLKSLGGLTGTLPYMSPEHLRGEPVDHRSDIYSLGVTLFEMASGTRPFSGATPADLIGSILRDPPRQLAGIRPELPQSLARLIHHCLDRRPDRRLQSVRDLCLVLEGLEGEHSSRGGGRPAPRAREEKPRRRRAAALTALLAAGIVTGGVAVWRLSISEAPRAGIGESVGEAGPAASRPHYLAIRLDRRLAGEPGPEYFRHGTLALLERRFRAVDGLYLVDQPEAPQADFELSVDARQLGDRVSVVYRLVDEGSSSRFRGEALEGEADDLLPLLDGICDAAEDHLRRQAGLPVECLPLPPPTRDPRALDHYLRSREPVVEAAAAGSLDAAIDELAQAVAADPRFALAHAALGSARLQKARLEDDPALLAAGRDSCVEASRLDPTLESAHVCLGDALRQEGRVGDAAVEYQRAIELGDSRSETFRKLGLCFGDLGRPESAEAAWRRIIEARPDLWLGYSSLALLYTNSSRMELALAQYERALELAPRNRDLYMGIFAVSYYLGRTEEAIEALQQSIAVSPDYRALSNLGHVYFLLRRFDEAVSNSEKAVRDPDADYRAFGFLGRAYYWAPGRRGEAAPVLGKAVAMCRDALLSEPRNPGALINLATYEAMLGNADESREALRQALVQRPGDAHYDYLAALVHNLLGEEAVALGYLESAIEGGYPIAELRTTIELDNLRDEPRFNALLGGTAVVPRTGPTSKGG